MCRAILAWVDSCLVKICKTTSVNSVFYNYFFKRSKMNCKNYPILMPFVILHSTLFAFRGWWSLFVAQWIYLWILDQESCYWKVILFGGFLRSAVRSTQNHMKCRIVVLSFLYQVICFTILKNVTSSLSVSCNLLDVWISILHITSFSKWRWNHDFFIWDIRAPLELSARSIRPETIY